MLAVLVGPWLQLQDVRLAAFLAHAMLRLRLSHLTLHIQYVCAISMISRSPQIRRTLCV